MAPEKMTQHGKTIWRSQPMTTTPSPVPLSIHGVTETSTLFIYTSSINTSFIPAEINTSYTDDGRSPLVFLSKSPTSRLKRKKIIATFFLKRECSSFSAKLVGMSSQRSSEKNCETVQHKLIFFLNLFKYI